MRRYRGLGGDERIWFEATEIEQIMTSELRKASMVPGAESPVVDLERFVERHLGATLDQYGELDATVLGVTEFFEGKPPRISINKDLTGAAIDEDDSPLGVRGRWRATLAHEAAHVLLHRSLYEFAVGNMSLFATDSKDSAGRQLHRCLKREVTYRGASDWREVQANQGMAALLMPKGIFQKIALEEITTIFPGLTKIPHGAEDRVAQRLAPRFEVSKEAARIRLSTLGLVNSQGQQRL
jgi:hypothetical protein